MTASQQHGQVPARSDSAHETPALTALLAQEACFAFRALVDGVSLSWPSIWQRRRCQVLLVPAAPQHLTAPVRAGDPSPARWQRPGADQTAWRYGTVTRRHLGSASRFRRPPGGSPRNAPRPCSPSPAGTSPRSSDAPSSCHAATPHPKTKARWRSPVSGLWPPTEAHEHPNPAPLGD